MRRIRSGLLAAEPSEPNVYDHFGVVLTPPPGNPSRLITKSKFYSSFEIKMLVPPYAVVDGRRLVDSAALAQAEAF